MLTKKDIPLVVNAIIHRWDASPIPLLKSIIRTGSWTVKETAGENLSFGNSLGGMAEAID